MVPAENVEEPEKGSQDPVPGWEEPAEEPEEERPAGGGVTGAGENALQGEIVVWLERVWELPGGLER